MWRFSRPESLAAGKKQQIKNGPLSPRCPKAGKQAEVNRVELVQDFFRSFWLEREKRNTSEDVHRFRVLSRGRSCTI